MSLNAKLLLKLVNQTEPEERDEALKAHIKLRHYDEVWYLLQDMSPKSIEHLTWRLAKENNEVIGRLEPETL